MNSGRRQPNRPAPTWMQIFNPIWLLSDALRNPNWTWIQWFLRNPCCNLTSTVIGICHLERDVFWRRGAGWTYIEGLNYGYSIPVGRYLHYPFVSWRGRWVECFAGWKTSGAFGINLRVSRSSNATETP